MEGMDMKISEPITAGHLISAARLGNSKADAVLNKGERTEREASPPVWRETDICINVKVFCYLKKSLVM